MALFGITENIDSSVGEGQDIFSEGNCQDRFSSTILLGGPGLQGTNEEVSPDTSRC